MYYITGFKCASSTEPEWLFGLNIIMIIKCLYLILFVLKSSSVAFLLMLTEPGTHSIAWYFSINFLTLFLSDFSHEQLKTQLRRDWVKGKEGDGGDQGSTVHSEMQLIFILSPFKQNSRLQWNTDTKCKIFIKMKKKKKGKKSETFRCWRMEYMRFCWTFWAVIQGEGCRMGNKFL